MTSPSVKEPPYQRVAAVAIGRNEGARLIRCLESLRGRVGRVIYVDSGSTDGSVAAARGAEAEVAQLGTEAPFTPGRARNAGFALLTGDAGREFVQFIDGDCELLPGWIEAATALLDAAPDVAVVSGRVRERNRDATVYNRFADQGWNAPEGETLYCGGIAMMRAEAFRAALGFNETLIAGEEPELCVRLRQAGWRIWRLGDDMVLHDIAMTRFGQWWARSRRTGYAYAEGAHLHGAPPERHYVRETRRALIWGAGLPAAAILGAIASPWSLALLLAYPLQIVRLMRRGDDFARATLLTVGKFAEALGALDFQWTRIRRTEKRLIEYK